MQSEDKTENEGALRTGDAARPVGEATPGPWRAYTDSKRRVWLVVSTVEGQDGPAVAVDGEADARLIAAAPDLLAALLVDYALQHIGFTEKALRWLAERGVVAPAGVALVDWQKQMRNAAIAKATGASPEPEQS